MTPIKTLIHLREIGNRKFEVWRYSTFDALRILVEGKLPLVHTGKPDYIKKIANEYYVGTR